MPACSAARGRGQEARGRRKARLALSAASNRSQLEEDELPINVDRPIQFHDLRLLVNGGVIVDGSLKIIAAGPVGEALRPPDDAVVVANFAPGPACGSLSVMSPTPIQPDGWRDWRTPILDVVFWSLFPNLADMELWRGEPARFSATAVSGQLLRLRQRYPADGPTSSPDIRADMRCVEGVATPSRSGVRLQMTAGISRTEANDGAPALTGARLECDVLLPWSYLSAMNRSPLRPDFAWATRSESRQWAPAANGLRALALSSGGRAFLSGHLTLPGQQTDLYPDRPIIHADLYPRVTSLRGAEDLRLDGDGFVDAKYNEGPELVLQLGYKDFARMLAGKRHATLDLRGHGIGHVDGQTGRAVYECGGPKQQLMTACRIVLHRGDEGLEVELSGELEPPPQAERAESLGPGFDAGIFIPNDYMLLMQWFPPDLTREWRERRAIKFE
jgi:hypothetical protein